ncbi:apical junction component 1 homolog [Callorhinchus milii]|uniref:apical junction component 1 homolog n=1 Tax=Callorhinchus milii TaxID=7868 RepID=UPI001C3F6671|nr:apical junction component 1 homolog [Callorhinchus milii]
MTRTDPPDILLSTVHRDLKVSPMPGEPKAYTPQRKCDRLTSSALQDTQQYVNKRQCRSFDFLDSLEPQQEAGNSMEELPYRQTERRTASPETSWDSLGRQVYHRSSAPDLVVSRLCAYSAEHREVPKPEPKRRLRSRSAPRVKTTFRPVQVASPELMRRGRDALRMPRESQRRVDTSPRRDAYYTSKYRMNEVHPIKLQPQRGEASHYPPLYVSENYESYEENQAAKPHVRYRVDIKPDEVTTHHPQPPRGLKTPQRQVNVSNWHMQPGRSLTVPAGRRFVKTVSPAESYGGDYWTLSTQSNYSPHRYYREDRRRGAPQVVPPQPVFSEYNYPEVRRPCRQYGQPNVYYTEDSSRMSQQRYTSPMHFHDWWGTNRAAHPHQSYPTPQILSHWDGRVGSLSPHGSMYGIMDQQRICTDTRSYSKSWDNILSPVGGGGGGHREFSVAHGLSYENLQQSPERRAPSPDGRRQPIVVNLSRSPKRYAALSLSESSIIEKVHGDGGRNAVGRSWYITPEITITDNDIRSNGLNRARFHPGGGEATDAGNSLSASFNDLLSCNADTVRDTGDNVAYGSPHQQPQLDDVLADLVIDTCKTPASRRPSEADTLVDQLRKLITDNDNPAELDLRKGVVHTTEPQKMKGFPFTGGLISSDLAREIGGHALGMLRSPSFPMASDGPPQDQSSDDVDTMMCSNLKCGLTETLFNARLYFKSCHSCYTYYCSRNCRKKDWEMHKECCVYGRVGSTCKRVLRICRENQDAHKAFSRIARMGYLSRGKGVLFLGFPNPGSAENFIQYGLESLVLAPTYMSVRELEGYADNLGEYSKEIQDAGKQYDPEECFLLNVSIALGQKVPENPSPRLQTPTVRRFAKISLASASPEKKVFKDNEMETLILTPPPGTVDIDKEGEVGRKAREVCFINVQRELRIRGVFLRHEYPNIYQDLCEFVESNKRFTPTTIYPIDKRTGKQFMCMIMAASEPLTLDWVGKPNLLEDIM